MDALILHQVGLKTNFENNKPYFVHGDNISLQLVLNYSMIAEVFLKRAEDLYISNGLRLKWWQNDNFDIFTLPCKDKITEFTMC